MTCKDIQQSLKKSHISIDLTREVKIDTPGFLYVGYKSGKPHCSVSFDPRDSFLVFTHKFEKGVEVKRTLVEEGKSLLDYLCELESWEYIHS